MNQSSIKSYSLALAGDDCKYFSYSAGSLCMSSSVRVRMVSRCLPRRGACGVRRSTFFFGDVLDVFTCGEAKSMTFLFFACVLGDPCFRLGCCFFAFFLIPGLGAPIVKNCLMVSHISEQFLYALFRRQWRPCAPFQPSAPSSSHGISYAS